MSVAGRDPVPLRARLADVASAARTSKPIASRSLNGDPTLSVGAELRAPEDARGRARSRGDSPRAHVVRPCVVRPCATRLAEHAPPAVTAVETPLAELGAAGVDSLLE